MIQGENSGRAEDLSWQLPRFTSTLHRAWRDQPSRLMFAKGHYAIAMKASSLMQ